MDDLQLLESFYSRVIQTAPYKEWLRTKSGARDASKFSAYASAVLSQRAAARPAMETTFGNALCDAAQMAAGVTSGALVSTDIQTFQGSLLVATKNDGEQVRILVDGHQAVQMAPAETWTLDTTKLANGIHAIQFIYLNADGAELSRSTVAAFQVAN